MSVKLILVIEANNETRIFLEDTLRDEGYPVLSSANSKQANKILNDFPVMPDLIIADIYETFPEGLKIPLLFSSKRRTKYSGTERAREP